MEQLPYPYTETLGIVVIHTIRTAHPPILSYPILCDVARTHVSFRGSFVLGTEMATTFRGLHPERQGVFIMWFDLVREAVNEAAEE